MKLTGWWKNRSSAGKVELYTRWSFHFFVLVEIFSIGLAALGSMEGKASPAVALPLFLLVCAHSVLVGFLSSRALDWIVDRRERPTRLAAVTTALTGAAVLAVLALRAAGRDGGPTVAPTLVVGMTCFTSGTLVLCMREVRHMRYVAPVAAAGASVAALAFGIPTGESAGFAVGVLLSSAFFCAACGFSGWLLNTVHELDRAREVQAQLAVAEERLRFGRDLHDVMGRNLAVIALKSELAVQLARRERPEAVDQMIEVQRIAQESQKEVRDVVRGYREADLAVELEGARGVLRAAGMDCRVEFETDRDLPPEAQSALGWVVREATTNVLRHGDARSCVIRLTAEERTGALTLVVENDGAPKAPAGPPGSGLAGLRERLAALDGTLEAGPVGGGRFRLRAEIPGPAGPMRQEARA
ncbi:MULTISPECIES: histidine kinase [unclassified Streptomyces]|uniref:sensor histidine kinase n=1 Tax=unclassified Streptomyces TaxID=2593676 RepID=UPI000DC780D5|nr:MULTISPECIES: histidine kinase [unclassified Streptomyces]AWZ06075.1 sensor histidine kinase [Streptomyces sp. ICC4]AWZ13693.1 sensor histidine kinase [Streptomyces sp. ICC1]